MELLAANVPSFHLGANTQFDHYKKQAKHTHTKNNYFIIFLIVLLMSKLLIKNKEMQKNK